jgi:hypothetical protein
MRMLLVALMIVFPCFTSSAESKSVRNEEIYQNRLEADAWKRLIEQQAARQQAGEKMPEGRDITWKEYWSGWFSFLRNPNGLPWKGSEFKTSEDMIRYIKATLKTHGLPTYE